MKQLIQIAQVIVMMTITIFVTSCQSTKNPGTALDQIKPASSDEQAIFESVTALQNHISNSEWDEWLALYADDAVLTNGRDKVSKREMRNVVEGISYKITELKVLNKEIGADQAKVSVQFLGNGKKQLETYHYKKINNEWLIFMETNP